MTDLPVTDAMPVVGTGAVVTMVELLLVHRPHLRSLTFRSDRTRRRPS